MKCLAKLRFGFAMALAALLLAACGSSSSSGSGGSSGSGSSSATYEVGVGVPLTGVAASAAPIFLPGYSAAVSYINSNHLIKGTMKVTTGDDQCLPAPTVTMFQKFVSVDHVIASTIICSAPVQAAAALGARDDVPVINGTASSPNLAGISDVINLNPLLQGEVPPVLSYAAKTLHEKRVVVVYASDALGQDGLKLVKQSAASLGMTVAGAVSVSPSQTGDFSSQAAQVEALHPQAVYFAIEGAAPALATAIRAAGVNATILAYDVLDEAGSTTTPALNDSIFGQEYIGLNSTDSVTQGFVKAFEAAHHGAMPTSDEAEAANSIIAVADAIAGLQKEGKAVNGSDISSWWKAQKSLALIGGPETLNYPGAVVSTKISVVKISNGKDVTVQVASPSAS